MMKRWITTWLLFLTLPAISAAGDVRGSIVYDVDLGVEAGYRVDDLDWNIAGNTAGTNPDILSELVWSDLEIFQAGLSGRFDAGRSGSLSRLYAKASVDYGWIVEGENRDSDFGGDGRTLEWSRSVNDAGDGEVYDISVGAGMKFQTGSGNLVFIPLAGYSYHRQNLVLRDGLQVLSDPGGVAPPPGPIVGLDSSYDAEWRGPWLGLDVHWRPRGDLRLFGGFEVHRFEYRADARWNLRTDLAQPTSFSHAADGAGIVLNAGADYSFSEWWTIGLDIRYRQGETENGQDRIFFSDGTSAFTRLNEVNWESRALTVRVVRRWF